MPNPFKSNSIRKRVMEVIDAKILEVQKLHDEEVLELQAKLEREKEACLDKHIKSIIGKIL